MLWCSRTNKVVNSTVEGGRQNIQLYLYSIGDYSVNSSAYPRIILHTSYVFNTRYLNQILSALIYYPEQYIKKFSHILVLVDI